MCASVCMFSSLLVVRKLELINCISLWRNGKKVWSRSAFGHGFQEQEWRIWLYFPSFIYDNDRDECEASCDDEFVVKYDNYLLNALLITLRRRIEMWRWCRRARANGGVRIKILQISFFLLRIKGKEAAVISTHVRVPS